MVLPSQCKIVWFEGAKYVVFRVHRRTDWQSLPVQQQNVVLELVQAVATISLVSLGIWISTLLSS